MNQPEDNTHIHFIGIGGCGVSALAQIAHSRSYVVTGSDKNESIYTKKLLEKGISVFFKHEASNITEDINIVVRSSAIPDSNIEVRQAEKLGLPVIKHAQFLGILMEEKYSICISGTHGKTTTDAILGFILKEAELFPTVEVGGFVPEFDGNVLIGDSRYFVAEACEFDHSFLHLKPNIAVLLNIESDHPDYYPDKKTLKKAFVDFLNLVPDDGYIIANDESKDVQDVLKKTKSKAQIITFGFHKHAEMIISQERMLKPNHWQFQLSGMEKRRKPVLSKQRSGVLPFEMALNGKHNILNVTAALIVSDLLGLDMQMVKEAIMNFGGVNRRFEVVDDRFGIKVITDYAHHPSQIKATIKAAKKQKFKNLIVVFQPHTFSRTKALFNEFSKCFVQADKVIITKTYIPVGRREKKLEGYTASDLVQEVKKYMSNVSYIARLEQVREKLQNSLNIGDGVLLLGAGDIYEIGRKILDRDRKIKR